jgi:hypothetical protein
MAGWREASFAIPRLLPTSWPGLTRPSTPCLVRRCAGQAGSPVKPGDDTCGLRAPRRASSDSTVKQPLRFRHASSPPLFAARGRRRRLHSRPLVRGRAERRVPVAPLGLMRMRSSAIRVHQDFRRRRASARRSACGVFSVACTSALANGPITKISVPGRRDRVASSSWPDAFRFGRPSHCPGLFPSQGRPSPCQWQCWRRSVLPEDRRPP